MMTRHLLLAALVALLGLGTAGATTTTTTVYESGSASPDIDVSCKEFSVASTGVLSATCNQEQSDGSLVESSTTFDLDTALECDYAGKLSWGGTDFSDNATGIALELDSTGRDLWVVATCTNVEQARQEKDGALDDGLDNSDGSLARTVE